MGLRHHGKWTEALHPRGRGGRFVDGIAVASRAHNGPVRRERLFMTEPGPDSMSWSAQPDWLDITIALERTRARLGEDERYHGGTLGRARPAGMTDADLAARVGEQRASNQTRDWATQLQELINDPDPPPHTIAQARRVMDKATELRARRDRGERLYMTEPRRQRPT